MPTLPTLSNVRDAPRPFPEEELRVLRATKLNGLVIGPPAATDSAIEQLTAGRHERLWFWTPAQPIRMSARTVVIIRDVGVLAKHVQAGWLAALEASSRERPLQVLATNSFSLFPLVARGLFLDALYYRLNCVLVDLRRGGRA